MVPEETWGAMETFLDVDGSGFMGVHNLSKLTELYTLNGCSLLYANYTL